MSFLDLLKTYSASPSPQADTSSHFDQVAREAPREDLGAAISAMFKSSSTAPFGQTVGSLFNESNPAQKAGVLNSIVQSLGPSASTAAGAILGRMFGSTGASTVTPTVTADQASRLEPADVSALAAHAEAHNPSVIDTVGSFYAQHPTLVKSLGVAALAVAMSHMRH